MRDPVKRGRWAVGGGRKILLASAFCLLPLAIAGCSVGPAYERPSAELPAAYTDVPARGATAPAERWWTLYGDPALDRLVVEALAHNQDLALAVARVDEARAQARVVDSLQVPSVDATFQRDRTRNSERSPFSRLIWA